MDEVSDSELRALLDGGTTSEEEDHLGALLAESPELQQRFEQLSGAQEFATHFDASAASMGDIPTPPPEARQVVDSILGSASDSDAQQVDPISYLEHLAPAEDADALGRLGNYEVSEHIATGGMGVVLRARDPELERTVAIKMLSPAYAGSETAKERFHGEAKAAAAIDHPNVIPIHAVDRSSAELPFLVMRYVEGGTLAERLDKVKPEPLPLGELLPIARGIAAGLAAAHAEGLIHRDIKPSNIMLEGDDGPGVWITDFGLARASAGSAITRPNTFLGTPEFASPEQIQSHEVDQRSDLFSFGSLLYLMATGKSAFAGEDFAALTYQIVHTPHTAPGEANPDLPDWLVELVDRLLAKDPSDRPGAAEEVLCCLENETLAPRKARRSGSSIIAWVAAAAVIITGLVLFARLKDPTATPATSSAITIVSSGKQQGFDSLGQAIAAADGGDTIEIADSERRTTGTIGIPQGKSLTIRAAPGHRPIFAVPIPTPVFATAAPLVLEGLTLEQPAGEYEPSSAAVYANGAPLHLANCRLLRHCVLGAPTDPGVAPPLVMSDDGPMLVITNCELYGRDASGFRMLPDGDGGQRSVHVLNTIVATNGVVLLSHSPTPQPIEVELERNTFACQRFLAVNRARGRTPPKSTSFAVTAQKNIFAVATFGVIGRILRPEHVTRTFTWSSQNNLYLRSGVPILTGGGSDEIRNHVNSQFDWADEPDRVVTDSERIREFPNLAAAGDFSAVRPDTFTIPETAEATTPENYGPDLDLVGPGEAYAMWRASSAYASWVAGATP